MITRIVDSHHHFWNTGLIPVPWLEGRQASFGDPSTLPKHYTTSEYGADAKPLVVRGSVHVEPAGRPDDAALEAFWLTGLAEGSSLPSAVIAYADITAPDFGRHLDMLQRSPLVRGVRMRLNYDAASGRKIAANPDIMASAAARAGLSELGRRDLVFDLSVFAPQLPRAALLAEAVPHCQFILEHVGWPLATDARAFDAWLAGLTALAARPNTAIKISGLWSVDRDWDQERITPWIRGAYEAFGPERCMFGSNLPIERLMCPLPEQVRKIARALSDIGPDALTALFEENTLRIFGITGMTATSDRQPQRAAAATDMRMRGAVR